MELTKKESEIYNKGKLLQKKLGVDIFSAQMQELMKISRPNMSLYIKILKDKKKLRKSPKGAGSTRIHFI